MTVLTVIAFGAGLGFLHSAIGILLAALVTYYADRSMRRETLPRIAGEKIDEVSGVLNEHGVLSVFAGDMVPFPPFAVQGIVAGAIRMHAWQYLLGSILGMAPGLLACIGRGCRWASESRIIRADTCLDEEESSRGFAVRRYCPALCCVSALPAIAQTGPRAARKVRRRSSTTIPARHAKMIEAAGINVR